MGIFDFSAPGVQENLVHIRGQMTDAQIIETEMRTSLAPLEDGGWIGQGAQAFFEEMRELLAENDRLQRELSYFYQTLNQAMETVVETMQAIDNITRSQ